MTQHPATPADLMERFRMNVKAVKAIQDLSDGDIAAAGKYASRQLLNHRLTGRTIPDLDDLARVAAALKIDPTMILAPLSVITKWIEDNPNYVPPSMPDQIAGRDIRNGISEPEPEPEPAPKRPRAGKAPVKVTTSSRRTATAR
jgi:transcriptional regulator with XRE-family HTH domain